MTPLRPSSTDFDRGNPAPQPHLENLPFIAQLLNQGGGSAPPQFSGWSSIDRQESDQTNELHNRRIQNITSTILNIHRRSPEGILTPGEVQELETQDGSLRSPRTRRILSRASATLDGLTLPSVTFGRRRSPTVTTASDSHSYLMIQVSLKELEEQPEKVLHDLYRKLLSLRPQANLLHVKFVREDGSVVDGFDGGGPSRTLLNRLFEMLIARSSLSFKEEKGGVLPVVNSELEQKSYQAIGRIMKLCLDHEDYLIGSHFDHSFFDALARGNESTLVIYQALHQNDENITKMFNFLNANELTEEAVLYAYPENKPKKVTLQVVKERIRKTLTAYADADKTIPAIVWIAKEINSLRDATSLRKAIQGEISKEILKERVICVPELDAYLQRWIDHASPKWIEKFIEVATGSKTLGREAISVEISARTSDALPNFHTCGRVVRIPAYTKYAQFKTKLEYSLDGALGDGGFQFH